MNRFNELVDPLAKWVAGNATASKISGYLLDFILPGEVKTYQVIAGPAHNLSLRLDARKQTAILFGTYERGNIDFLLKHVSQGSIFWDIGANLGYFSCIVARIAVKGCVVSIEPLPDNIELLNEHIHLNRLKNVFLVEKAVSSWQGQGLFIKADNPYMGRISEKRENQDLDQIEISVTTVDQLASSGLPLPTILKIDAEGQEGLILEGAVTVLKERSPSLLIEIHTLEAAGHCWDILRSLGYDIQALRKDVGEPVEKYQDIYGRHIWAEKVK